MVRVANPVRFQRLSDSQLSSIHEGLLLSVSWRDVLDLDRNLLWAGRLRLVGGLGRLHDLHVRLDGQMIGKGIACRVDAMRGVIDRRASDGCKPSLDWPGTCPGVARDSVGAGQLAVKTRHQHCSNHVARQGDLRWGDGRCRSKCCATSSRGLVAEVRCWTCVAIDL